MKKIITITGIYIFTGLAFLLLQDNSVLVRQNQNREKMLTLEFEGTVESVAFTRTGEFLTLEDNHKKIKFYSCIDKNGNRFADMANKGDFVVKEQDSLEITLHTDKEIKRIKIC
ncbi:hypothetical protein [uncultured Kordia sp.]|uniref:hypothetical protein n=1 Tax=uncultured Kordia sp. TaxID=507699 RepID=UPI00261DEFFB|nr:hypothetical protein [uncultured Kordia sp.]